MCLDCVTTPTFCNNIISGPRTYAVPAGLCGGGQVQESRDYDTEGRCCLLIQCCLILTEGVMGSN